jgi:hypothetical protein
VYAPVIRAVAIMSVFFTVASKEDGRASRERCGEVSSWWAWWPSLRAALQTTDAASAALRPWA